MEVLFPEFESFIPLLAGPRFKDAFQDPTAFLAIEPLFEVCFFPRENRFQAGKSLPPLWIK